MQKAERGCGSGRFIRIVVLGILGVALAGCGDDESGSSTAATGIPSNTSGTTPPQTAADSGAGSSGSSGSGSTGSTGTVSSPPASTPSSSTSVTLGWVAPTQNSNGSPITDLAGYKIHYGTASQSYSEVVSVSNPSLSRYVLDSLKGGTYFFAITAYNSKGIESALSGEISATLD